MHPYPHQKMHHFHIQLCRIREKFPSHMQLCRTNSSVRIRPPQNPEPMFQRL